MSPTAAIRSPSLGQRCRAWLHAHAVERADRPLKPHRERLLADLRGDVLELGPGVGTNLRHLPADVCWTGVEPNPAMHPYIRTAAERLGLRVRIDHGVAEQLAFDEATFDAVIVTHVLCTVRDPAAAVREIRRVLRPGGRLYFIEHVAAASGTPRRRRQEFVRPFWSLLTAGCQPQRDTAQTLAGGGFSHLDFERRQLPFPIVAPHILGTATK